jgi:hypothetical protein
VTCQIDALSIPDDPLGGTSLTPPNSTVAGMARLLTSSLARKEPEVFWGTLGSDQPWPFPDDQVQTLSRLAVLIVAAAIAGRFGPRHVWTYRGEIVSPTD